MSQNESLEDFILDLQLEEDPEAKANGDLLEKAFNYDKETLLKKYQLLIKRDPELKQPKYFSILLNTAKLIIKTFEEKKQQNNNPSPKENQYKCIKDNNDVNIIEPLYKKFKKECNNVKSLNFDTLNQNEELLLSHERLKYWKNINDNNKSSKRIIKEHSNLVYFVYLKDLCIKLINKRQNIPQYILGIYV